MYYIPVGSGALILPCSLFSGGKVQHHVSSEGLRNPRVRRLHRVLQEGLGSVNGFVQFGSWAHEENRYDGPGGELGGEVVGEDELRVLFNNFPRVGDVVIWVSFQGLFSVFAMGAQQVEHVVVSGCFLVEGLVEGDILVARVADVLSREDRTGWRCGGDSPRGYY